MITVWPPTNNTERYLAAILEELRVTRDLVYRVLLLALEPKSEPQHSISPITTTGESTFYLDATMRALSDGTIVPAEPLPADAPTEGGGMAPRSTYTPALTVGWPLRQLPDGMTNAEVDAQIPGNSSRPLPKRRRRP
jgi:hypothetical protein